MRIGALEAGGTKMVCAIGDENGHILEQNTIFTETTELTMSNINAYFKEKEIDALGVGCFGPIDLNVQSPTYGYITCTPKLQWKNFNFVGTLRDALHCPIGFDTDVNSSVLGEVTFGRAKEKNCVLYLTVGTGIGAGVYVNGDLLHGSLHPEAGHILIRKREDDTFMGNCPYHMSCLEGLAAGPAIEARWGKKGQSLSDNRKVWDLEAYYLAEAIANYIFILSPEMIILGGGVMGQEQLFPMIHRYVKQLLGDYIHTKEINNMEQYIVPASLCGNQGIMGCFQLGKLALLK